MDISEKIEMLRTVQKDDINEQFILDLGLNNIDLDQQPQEYSKYFGTGLFIWQYPNQFSSFLKSIFDLKVESYMEIGVCKGGSFVAISEILARNNPNIKLYAVDIIEIESILQEYINHRNFTYIQLDSEDQSFKDFCKYTPINFVFIDGNHTFEGVHNDYLIFKNKLETKHFVFHDIVNCVCPGVSKTWEIIKNNESFYTEEFIQQYESVGKPYLGIGHAIRK